jgi:hypothetical protein
VFRKFLAKRRICAPRQEKAISDRSMQARMRFAVAATQSQAQRPLRCLEPRFLFSEQQLAPYCDGPS